MTSHRYMRRNLPFKVRASWTYFPFLPLPIYMHKIAVEDQLNMSLGKLPDAKRNIVGILVLPYLNILDQRSVSYAWAGSMHTG